MTIKIPLTAIALDIATKVLEQKNLQQEHYLLLKKIVRDILSLNKDLSDILSPTNAELRNLLIIELKEVAKISTIAQNILQTYTDLQALNEEQKLSYIQITEIIGSRSLSLEGKEQYITLLKDPKYQIAAFQYLASSHITMAIECLNDPIKIKNYLTKAINLLQQTQTLASKISNDFFTIILPLKKDIDRLIETTLDSQECSLEMTEVTQILRSTITKIETISDFSSRGELLTKLAIEILEKIITSRFKNMDELFPVLKDVITKLKQIPDSKAKDFIFDNMIHTLCYFNSRAQNDASQEETIKEEEAILLEETLQEYILEESIQLAKEIVSDELKEAALQPLIQKLNMFSEAMIKKERFQTAYKVLIKLSNAIKELPNPCVDTAQWSLYCAAETFKKYFDELPKKDIYAKDRAGLEKMFESIQNCLSHIESQRASSQRKTDTSPSKQEKPNTEMQSNNETIALLRCSKKLIHQEKFKEALELLESLIDPKEAVSRYTF